MLVHVGSCWPMLAQVGPKFVQIGWSWSQMNPKWVPSWSHVGPSWAKLNSGWPKVGPKLAQAGPSWPQVGPKLVQVGPCWLMLAPSWPHDVPCPNVWPRLAKVSTKALPLRLGFSKMSTKALPQAFQHLIVRSGCSIPLPLILKIVSSW